MRSLIRYLCLCEMSCFVSQQTRTEFFVRSVWSALFYFKRRGFFIKNLTALTKIGGCGNKRLVLILVIAILSFIILLANRTTDKKISIADIAYDANKYDNHTVYLLEKQGYEPYLVLTKDYYGNVLLLRKNLLDTPKNINDYSSYYENSNIDEFLNVDFLDGFGNFCNNIIVSDIEITSEDAIGYSLDNTKKIKRKVFLLSCTELNIHNEVNQAHEGKPLDFFKNYKNRCLENSNNSLSSWWLRTPNTYYLSCTYGISSDGVIGVGNSSNENGIRPAFCVPSSLKVKATKDIIEDTLVYVISIKE